MIPTPPITGQARPLVAEVHRCNPACGRHRIDSRPRPCTIQGGQAACSRKSPTTEKIGRPYMTLPPQHWGGTSPTWGKCVDPVRRRRRDSAARVSAPQRGSGSAGTPRHQEPIALPGPGHRARIDPKHAAVAGCPPRPLRTARGPANLPSLGEASGRASGLPWQFDQRRHAVSTTRTTSPTVSAFADQGPGSTAG